MALKAGYVGVKRWLYEKLQATTTKNVQDIADIWTDNTKTGVHNILDSNAATDDNFTVNSDKSVSTNTTFSTRTVYYIRTKETNFAPAAGNYIASVSATVTKLNMVVDAYNGTTWVKNLAKTTTSTPFSIDYVGYDRIAVYLLIEDVPAAINATFYPMIRFATDPDATYAPFAMTNRQLTKSIIKTTGTFDQVTANKSGYMVELSFTGTTITNEDGKTLGTLDAAYRPGANINFYTKVYNGSSYVDAQVKVTASTGAVELLTLSGSAVTGAQVNFLLARPVFMSGSAAGLSRGVSDTREASPEVIADDPEPVTKTTRKSTKKEDN